MSVLPSDDRSVAIVDKSDQSDSSNRKDRLAGMTFAVLASLAMAGWLYLIVKMLWTSVNWLVF